MKKIFIIVLAFVFLVGCGNKTISQNDYDDVVKERDELLLKLEKLQTEYDDYKESMSEYENLSAAELESRAIESQRIIDEENARLEAEKKEEEEKKEAEEKLGYETGITYDQIARIPDDYMGKKVKFTGEVVQVLEGTNTVQMRFAVNEDYASMIYCEYNKSIVSERILEGDTITIYGSSLGLYTYESAIGTSITIPAVEVDKIGTMEDEVVETISLLVYEDENVSITYNGITESYMGYDINFLVENKSERTLILSMKETSIDGYMVDAYCYMEISPGKKMNDGATVYSQDLENISIDSISNIETKFNIYDSTDWSWDYETGNIIVLDYTAN